MQKFTSNFIYFKKLKNFRMELGANVVLVKVLYDLNELSSTMFYSAISNSVQRILSNVLF